MPCIENIATSVAPFESPFRRPMPELWKGMPQLMKGLKASNMCSDPYALSLDWVPEPEVTELLRISMYCTTLRNQELRACVLRR